MDQGTENTQKRNESFTSTMVKSGSETKKGDLDNESSSESQSIESSKQSKQGSLKDAN